MRRQHQLHSQSADGAQLVSSAALQPNPTSATPRKQPPIPVPPPPSRPRSRPRRPLARRTRAGRTRRSIAASTTLWHCSADAFSAMTPTSVAAPRAVRTRARRTGRRRPAAHRRRTAAFAPYRRHGHGWRSASMRTRRRHGSRLRVQGAPDGVFRNCNQTINMRRL